MTTGRYKSLNIIEAIRTRPGMYVGSTETPDQLFTEAIDNVLDEISNGFASESSITINDNNDCYIYDNGRGINVYQMQLSDNRIEDSVVALCTVTHTGSKFDNNEYKHLIGMHGVGLVAINALSEYLRIYTNSNNVTYEYLFINSEFKSKTIIDEKILCGWSTMINFKPSAQFFENCEFNKRLIIERIILAQSKLTQSRFYFNNQQIPKYTFNQYVEKMLNSSDLNKIEYKTNNSIIIVYITYDKIPDSIICGDVNLRSCEGKYLVSLQTLVKNTIIDILDKKYKNISQNLLLLGLRIYCSVTIPEPKYDSQTKTKMILDLRQSLILPLKNQLKNILSKRHIKNIIIKHIENHLIKNIGKNKKSTRINETNKLIDCVESPGNIIYLLEGDSAAGPLRQIRNIKNEAIFPLKGKVLNIENSNFEKIKNNKEIQDLLEALGPYENRRYKKIKIIADADPDGHHIIVLLLLFIQKFANDFIKSGNLSIVMPPLYGATKGSVFISVYSEEKIDFYRSQGYKIQRFKGLGEMDAKMLKQTLTNNFEYIVQWPKTIKKLEAIISIVLDTNIKRKLLNDDRVKIEKLFDEIQIQNQTKKENQK